MLRVVRVHYLGRCVDCALVVGSNPRGALGCIHFAFVERPRDRVVRGYPGHGGS